MRITIDTDEIKEFFIEVSTSIAAFLIKPFITKKRKEKILKDYEERVKKAREKQLESLFGRVSKEE